MFSIKNSKFSDCFSCSLLSAPSCILETNCQKDLSKVDIIIAAENPGKQEILERRPLIGRSGQTFRKYFNKYLNKLNYLITNVVLCCTIDENGRTSNPNDETIQRCKYNLLNMVEICQPKLIMCLGESAIRGFDIDDVRPTKDRGKIFKWKNFDILFTLHPSYVNRKKNTYIENDFEKDFIKAANILGSDIQISDREENQFHVGKKGEISYKIPEEYYLDEYRLIDVQYVTSNKEVLYIFRDKNNKKIYYKRNDDYYCYQCLDKNIENRLIVKYDDLNQVMLKYEDRGLSDKNITYEGDLKIQDKHIIDYYIKNKGECFNSNLNILYLDIEVDIGESMSFPSPADAKSSICLITTKFNEKFVTYVLDNGGKVKEKENVEIKIFKNEKEMLKGFVEDLKKTDLDLMVGWNIINFDLTYIYNRMKKLELNPNELSPFGEIYIDGERGIASIPGFVVVDMCELYKHFQLTKRENYKLGTIAQIELEENKLEFDGSFSSIYKKDLDKFIDYNIRDVDLLARLEDKLKFIQLLNELRIICSGSFQSCRRTFGRLDCLVIRYLKEKGLASKNSEERKKEEFVGAYVQETLKGIHNYVVDFDFKSLYPSIILTYNIGVNTFAMKFVDILHGYDLSYKPESLPEEFDVIIDPLYKNEKIKYTKEKLFKEIKEKNLIYTINGCFYKSHIEESSFYGEILNHLMGARSEYKNKMFEAKQIKDKEKITLFKLRQETYKILANALYGILGNEHYRFFNVDLAKSITCSGQEITKTSILSVDKYIENILKNTENENVFVPRHEIFSDNMKVNLKHIVTGDTDSIFVTFKKLIPKDKSQEEAFSQMKIWCDEIQNYLNEKMVNQIINRHSVAHEKNRLNIKNELMSKRGLFVAMKKYALSVVYQEGKLVNEREIKGLETRRREYSAYTKQCLSELIDFILDSEKISLKLIDSFIKEKEIEFINRIKNGDKSIAKAVGFGKKLEDYKVVPENVTSMQNWNNILYEAFYPGTYGYLFKVSGINYERAPREIIEKYNKYILDQGKKFTAIAIPDEEPRLPDYFIPNIKEMLEFAWIDRCKLLLDPILESKQIIMKF